MEIKQRDILKAIEPHLNSCEAIITTGMHGTGKSTVLEYFFDHIASDNKIFIHLENPVNRRVFEANNYEEIKSTFEFLGLDLSQPSTIFIDDIQFVTNLPSVVSYFIDHYKVKFFMVCSADFYSGNNVVNLLPGRKYLFKLSPLNFREYLQFKDIKLSIPDDPKKITKSAFDTVAPYYKEYLRFGGFPGVVLKTNYVQKMKALEEIFSSFYQMLVLQLGDHRSDAMVRDLLLYFLSHIGVRLNIQRLSKELHISRPTLYRYLSLLENTYFISIIKPVSHGKGNEIRNMPKIYICDSGLANLLGPVDEKCIFENSVLQHLKNRGEVNYYYRKSGVLIDFIIDKKHAYKLSMNPTESGTRKFIHLARQLGFSDCKIVSKNYSALRDVVYGFML